MSQVSKRIINKKIEEKINSLFFEAIASCVSKSSVSEFLDDLLTETENIMLSKRLAIAYLLLKGTSHREINHILKVSNPTIRSVSLLLHYKGNGLRKALTLFEKRKQLKNFFEDLGEAALELLNQGKGGSWRATQSYKHQHTLRKQSPL